LTYIKPHVGSFRRIRGSKFLLRETIEKYHIPKSGEINSEDKSSEDLSEEQSPFVSRCSSPSRRSKGRTRCLISSLSTRSLRLSPLNFFSLVTPRIPMSSLKNGLRNQQRHQRPKQPNGEIHETHRFITAEGNGVENIQGENYGRDGGRDDGHAGGRWEGIPIANRLDLVYQQEKLSAQ